MKLAVSFRGATGQAHSFEQVDPGSAWARHPGVALFAAPDAFGWRVIRIVELSGKPHDVQPLWALSDAERYGATAVFVDLESDAHVRRAVIADLERGMTPVCALDENFAIAA